tara:strand:- start:975 stop:1559 length:585 start_codon:yes stop_codon:yes gene_type:complete
MCVHKLTTALSTQLAALGPRSEEQYTALFNRIAGSASWATPDSPEFALCAVRFDGKVMHPLHAEAIKCSRSVDFMLLPVNFVQAKAGGRSAFVTSIIDTAKIKGQWYARAKTRHQMYNPASMMAGIKAAGLKGILRSEIAGEYKEAYTDLETLIHTSAVFATPLRVWSREVAPEVPREQSAAFRKKFRSLLHGI